ncbi:uncharacterized protein K460DRAFT_368690 [Cucurbitaria berberidis CBS 394.84]|uniref:Uncharacterized protein n=1 Tax=Cucurbitaria berberidis CBS 394.84 TaxID=1168544 RepID=A0A9P4L6H5_9PLEO|nr:uncharacterized protein K460DRAFT_368690 [Cucurbitaria berberidis CBS 394.84]KAF1843830.1 hypothetical protein K460DRAFT_368690 [Cucurbitaria berberidis CBS 394.84]
MDISGQTHSERPALNTIPSELRRQIVSYIAPDPEHLRPGCKRHLKTANLAHSCLREWVTEYMFRDMALTHVLPGMSSHLEVFAVSRENAGLLKYVKHIVVQVPPAIRWEVGVDDPFAVHPEEITTQRLCQRFRVKNYRQMNDEQQEYCLNYHRAMVEPFTNNRRWQQLFRTANATWAQLFARFTHLDEISVKCCERVDQPRPTYTHTFVLQYGKFIHEDEHPKYVEDSTVNIAWASSVICRSAPPTVRSLRLSMANMDNLSSIATVNRLLSLSYRQPNVIRYPIRITRLSLSLRGVAGVHGNRDWKGDTGSAGSVRFWKGVLNTSHGLQHLELRNSLTMNEDIRFSNLENSDSKACVLAWLLPGLAVSQLRTLRLCDFMLEKAVVQPTFSGHWPRLEALILDDIQLLLREEKEGIDAALVRFEHLRGQSWMEVCRTLSKENPGLRIKLNRPVSNMDDFEGHRLHPTYVEKIQSIPSVQLDTYGYGSLVKLPNDELYSAQRS